mgnify:CR=1 FL=1
MVNKKPNIIFIMSDDHAAHAISCYSKRMDGRPVINETPNIDRIAEEGAIFDNCFCTNSICTPSRAVILTGKYSHLNGCTTIFTKFDSAQMTFPKIIQKNGYQTAMIGKWHLGYEPENLPTGFDHYSILMGQGPYFDPGMIVNGEKKAYEGYTTDIITDQTLDWIKQRDKSKPFMVMCHHKAPHRKWYPDDKHKDMYSDIEIPYPKTFNDDYKGRKMAEFAKMRVDSDFCALDLKIMPPDDFDFKKPIAMPENIEGYTIITDDDEEIKFDSMDELRKWKYQRYIKDYLRSIASIDDNIGRILDYLDLEEIADDTIVIYTSDQGFFLGDHGWYDKRFIYEESLRMPFVMRYPRKIKPGTIIDEIILNLDFAETLLDYAGSDIPDVMQGESFRPVCRGEKPGTWREAFYYRYFMVQSVHEVSPHYGIRTENFKLVYFYGNQEVEGMIADDKACEVEYPPAEWQLFDLQKDPFEINNVYGNPQYGDIMTELKKRMHQLQEECGDTPVDEI